MKTGNQTWAHSQPYLTVDNFAVEFEGREIGQLITLGELYIFYTPDPRLATLDAVRFKDPADVQFAIAKTIAAGKTRPVV